MREVVAPAVVAQVGNLRYGFVYEMFRPALGSKYWLFFVAVVIVAAEPHRQLTQRGRILAGLVSVNEPTGLRVADAAGVLRPRRSGEREGGENQCEQTSSEHGHREASHHPREDPAGSLDQRGLRCSRQT